MVPRLECLTRGKSAWPIYRTLEAAVDEKGREWPADTRLVPSVGDRDRYLVARVINERRRPDGGVSEGGFSMKTYWDLSEKDRAALTSEQVEKFIDAELMLKGVLAVAPLELVEVPNLEMPTETVYRIGGEYSASSLAFRTIEQAQAFLDLQPLEVTKDWQLGDVEFVRVFDRTQIRAVAVPRQQTAESKKAMLDKIAAARKENERRKEEFREASKKVEQALRGLWDDWHACRAEAERLQRIIDTFEKYVGIASGDESTAAKFLASAFTPDQIATAAVWANRPSMVAQAEVMQ